MAELIDITGMVFGRWAVIKKLGTHLTGNALWLCRCQCGNEKKMISQSLRNGQSKSCGCYAKDIKSIISTKHGHAKIRSSEYLIYHAMLDRCYNKNHREYANYGGRGIRICDRWLKSFEYFLMDMGMRPSNKHSIDRFPNNDGNYEPANCRWATSSEQTRNTTRNIWIEYNGEKMVLQDWAIKFGVDNRRLGEQLKIKSFDDAISFLLNPNRRKGRGSGTIRKVGRFFGNELIKEYSKIKDVSFDNFNVDSVYHALSNNRPHKNFIWKYLDEKAA